MKNINKMLLVASSAITLSACTNYNLSSFEDTTLTADDYTTTLINQFNELYDQETQLLPTFESDLEADQELKTFSNNDAEVFNNIKTRAETLESINQTNEELTKHVDYFTNYDGEELDQGEVTQLGEQIGELTSLVSTFTTDYQTALDNQISYFQSIGGSDASADTFIDGINTLNEEHAQLLEQSNQLNETFETTMGEIEAFMETVTSLSQESE